MSIEIYNPYNLQVVGFVKELDEGVTRHSFCSNCGKPLVKCEYYNKKMVEYCSDKCYLEWSKLSDDEKYGDDKKYKNSEKIFIKQMKELIKNNEKHVVPTSLFLIMYPKQLWLM